MEKPLDLAYFGSGEFAVAPLRALLNRPEQFRVRAVVCQPDRPAGRHRQMTACPVGQADLPDSVKVLKPPRLKDNREFIERMESLGLDLAVVAAYGQILPPALLETTRLGFLNLHGSLLPRWRGASPIQAAIRAGDRETGVTLMLMDEKMDHGPILRQDSLEIAPDDTRETLEQRLSRLAAGMTDDILAFAEGRLTPRPQNHDRATFCKTLTRQDGQVDWPNETAAQIGRKLRAFTPWPGLHTVWRRTDGSSVRIKLLGLRAREDKKDDRPPGTVSLLDSGNLAVTTADKRLVEITEAQMEGRQPCAGQAIACGHQDLIGAVLTPKEEA